MVIGLPKARKFALMLTGGVFLLTACEGGFDLGNLSERLDRRPTAGAAEQGNVAPRPKPDSRGLITYPNYQVIVARRNDTMNDVAGRVGLTGAELARYNGLPADYLPRSGEVLALPKGTVIPVEASDADAVASPNSLEAIAQSAIGRANDAAPKVAVQDGPEPIRHVVEPGETIYSIARLYRVSVPALASWNGLGKDLAVREGQRLLIPVVEDGSVKSQDNDFVVEEPAPGEGSITPIPPSADDPLPDAVETAVIPESPDLVQDRTPVGASRKLLRPVSGEVLRGYSNKPGGNEGLDIAAAKGTSVKAAENGEVALVSSAGGNTKIVLIRHPDNLYTVYSNVSDVAVSKGQSVSRGQSIGKVAGGSPAFLHFEIRRGTESVNPEPYL
ncbi:peptidoglycan DD-metalloendopeptidase family protein [Amylibacter sp. IMCC11727]|uniref:peptidoglycan DD-metalloendopeptidase family protein n=1 Tax=Amylibacter sp. IMCC11727 TaxID=3039851 RepID=UPI00244DA823|nr:peptidoglycan DD-metalloendopeptidase family protein [Amylibacter sp. IMCC11727]WGI23462.1 peptidoglycan DD-metalloendopeptidase family protein [Amylibacter sp. IMCC11727]